MPAPHDVRLLRSLDQLPDDLRGGALSIGNFDGVHRGHARLIERLIATARKLGGPAIVFTFDPHPVRLLRPQSAPPPLTWTDRKAQLLDELGVTAVIAYPTDEALLALLPRRSFSKSFTKSSLAGDGRRHRISSLATIGPAILTRWRIYATTPGCRWKSFSRWKSATRLSPVVGCARQSAGDVDLARQLLTRPYRVRGMVTHGCAAEQSSAFHGQPGSDRYAAPGSRHLCSPRLHGGRQLVGGGQHRPESYVRRNTH